MTIYYIKQDNTIWGCGDSQCCGEYYEEIEESFIDCEHNITNTEMADHLQGCNGGGPILKWRKAKNLEIQAFRDGKDDGFEEGYNFTIESQKKQGENK